MEILPPVKRFPISADPLCSWSYLDSGCFRNLPDPLGSWRLELSRWLLLEVGFRILQTRSAPGAISIVAALGTCRSARLQEAGAISMVAALGWL